MLRSVDVLLLLVVTFWVCSPQAIAQLNQDARKKEASIKAEPSHIVLGSLPYGTKDDPVITRELTIRGFSQGITLTNIDLSHAEGIQILARHDAPTGVDLTLGIDVQQFSKNQPYGKFIKKIIRVETSSAEQPQLTISVIGWLAVNETSRNFNQFIFNDSERWQGWWGTPNMAGSVLAPLVLLFVGAMSWVWTNRAQGFRWLSIGIISLLLVDSISLLMLLAFTYSRGAWIAFATGSLAMIFYSEQLRKPAVMALIFFGIILFFLPSGLKRIESYTQVEADLSVANRLKLWTGALQMMAEHPLTGVGSNQFGTVFEQDYQRFDHTAENSTAVSDYFTFGAEHGLLFLGISLGLLLFIISESFRGAVQNKNVLQMTLTATLVAILITSAFSTLWFVREYEWIFGITLLGLFAFMLMQSCRTNGWKQQFIPSFIRASRLTAIVLVVLEIVSMVSLCFLPTKIHEFRLQIQNQEALPCHIVEPRWRKPKGIIVYFSDSMEDAPLLYHSTLRPLATLGWRVAWSVSVEDSNQAFEFVEALHLTFPDQKLFVAGDGKGGRTAWQGTVAMPDIVSAGAGFGFLSEDIDSNAARKLLRQPFLVFHSLYDDQISANGAIRAQQGRAFIGLPLTVILGHEELGRFSSGWLNWIRITDKYFSIN